MKEVVVMSLGGSLIAPPEGINVAFLKGFKQLILERLDKQRFIIISGGGYTCRHYQQAAKAVGAHTEDLDWLGIHVTRVNGHLLRTMFREHAEPKLTTKPDKDEIIFEKDIMIGAGWKPGWSTDYVATLLAKRFGVKRVLNLSNITHVYDKDPKEPGAKKFDHISWKDFRKIVGDEWDPGLNAPFDPVASKEGEAQGLEVYIAKGTDLENVKDILDGNQFVGTVIR